MNNRCIVVHNHFVFFCILHIMSSQLNHPDVLNQDPPISTVIGTISEGMLENKN